MTIKTDFQQILTDLLTLDRQVQLTLPANFTAVQHQRRQILVAQNQLCELEEIVQERYGRSGLPSVRRCDHHLRSVIHILRRRMSNLLLLAEEYQADPEGAIACLRIIERDHQRWLSQSSASGDFTSARV